MRFIIDPLGYEERKYTYAQSQQLRVQTGSIGRLRGDFDSNGYNFYTSWEDHCQDLKTPAFQNDLDEVIKALRSKEYGLLENRPAMDRFVRQHPDCAIKGNYTTEYGFRINSDEYCYLIRCNPVKGDYNFYCYCYQLDRLERHIENAQKDICFIDSRYNELFRLPDGDKIKITMDNGESVIRSCRYVDEYHVEVNGKIFHTCEFAERMESNHNRYEPAETPLPPYCFGLLPSTGEVIKITRFKEGYTSLNAIPAGKAKEGSIFFLNDAIGVSKAQAAALEAGSKFGWDCPAAKPKNYDENGKAIRSNEEKAR